MIIEVGAAWNWFGLVDTWALAAVETGGTHAGTYWLTYDGNGNVGQVLKVLGSGEITVAAKYEYDPYGNMLSALGDYAAANPFRFSTKWLDSELASWTTNGAVGSTGLYYYGYRYYSPRLGRWLSRDPIEEQGGLCLYMFVENEPVVRWDWLGLVCPIGQRQVCWIEGPNTHWECKCVDDGLPKGSQCNISLIPSWWGIMAHYTLRVVTANGAWDIDGGSCNNPSPLGGCKEKVSVTINPSILKNMPNDSSPCDCVTKAALNWTPRGCYRALCCPNSNTAIRVILEGCGVRIAAPDGAWCWNSKKL
jgi:RHS repeat-associated protein